MHHHQSDADAYRDDAMASSAFLLPSPRPLRRRLHSEWPGRESGQNRTPIFMTRTPVCSRVALRLERRDEQKDERAGGVTDISRGPGEATPGTDNSPSFLQF